MSVPELVAIAAPAAKLVVERALIVLVGNPNCGKTTLFNRLTGLSAKVGNYPGITVEHREGLVVAGGGRRARLVDLPGTYSLVPRADDEGVALRGILGTLPGMAKPDLVLVVVDATNLERNLYLLAQLREWRLPLVVVLTMMDTVESDGLTIDVARLEARLGVPVVRSAAVRSGGVAELLATLEKTLANPPLAEPLAPPDLDASAASLGALLARELPVEASPESLVFWALSVREAQGLSYLPLSAESLARIHAHPHAKDQIERVVAGRYVRVQGWLDGIVTRPGTIGRRSLATRSERLTSRIDAVTLHPVLGPLLLILVFGALFQALFSGAEPLMNGIEAITGWLASMVGALVPESLPLVRSLLVDGVVAGVGNVVVFVPQIAVLFLFLGILEDSGYLARAAFLLDRLMARVGLHGKAFVPMLSGFACAVPAIMATRTIENRKDRLVTILVTPLMSCSARLPVYGLMIATVFSTAPAIFGLVQPGAIVMVSMYLLSIGATLGMAAVFKRTLLRSPPPPFVLELPPYRLPRAGQLLRHVGGRVRSFLVDAGTVILAITIVLWGFFNFPRSAELAQRHEAELAGLTATIADGPARVESISQLEGRQAQDRLSFSIAGRLGHAIEPALAPLGFDWKVSVGIIAGFAAREVLVSTLGLVYGLGDGTDEASVSLREAMRSDRRADGTPVHSPLSGLSLMVFFVLAMQCMSTLAAVRRETGSWKWPTFQFAYMTVLAYVGALVVFQGGRLLGLG